MTSSKKGRVCAGLHAWLLSRQCVFEEVLSEPTESVPSVSSSVKSTSGRNVEGTWSSLHVTLKQLFFSDAEL